MHRGGGSPRRHVSPDLRDQLVERHDLIRAYDQGSEHCLYLACADNGCPILVHNPKWTKDLVSQLTCSFRLNWCETFPLAQQK
jgi:hypothetical protein